MSLDMIKAVYDNRKIMSYLTVTLKSCLSKFGNNAGMASFTPCIQNSNVSSS